MIRSLARNQFRLGVGHSRDQRRQDTVFYLIREFPIHQTLGSVRTCGSDVRNRLEE